MRYTTPPGDSASRSYTPLDGAGRSAVFVALIVTVITLFVAGAVVIVTFVDEFRTIVDEA
jgi:hypothetical protein